MKIPYTSGLVKKTNYNVKIIQIEVKLLNTNGLATTAAVDTVKNKIPDLKNIVKKITASDFDVKILDVQFSYFVTSDSNKQILNANIKEKDLVKYSDLQITLIQIATLATKAVLKVNLDKIVKLQALDSICFHGKINFGEDDT